MKIKENIQIIFSLIIMIGMITVVIWNVWSVAPEQMDMIYKSLENNPEHVESLTCENIELAIASAHQQMALNKPVKLIEKLKEIAKDKECQFERPDLWLDGYQPQKESEH